MFVAVCVCAVWKGGLEGEGLQGVVPGVSNRPVHALGPDPGRKDAGAGDDVVIGRVVRAKDGRELRDESRRLMAATRHHAGSRHLSARGQWGLPSRLVPAG